MADRSHSQPVGNAGPSSRRRNINPPANFGPPPAWEIPSQAAALNPTSNQPSFPRAMTAAAAVHNSSLRRPSWQQPLPPPPPNHQQQHYSNNSSYPLRGISASSQPQFAGYPPLAISVQDENQTIYHPVPTTFVAANAYQRWLTEAALPPSCNAGSRITPQHHPGQSQGIAAHLAELDSGMQVLQNQAGFGASNAVQELTKRVADLEGKETEKATSESSGGGGGGGGTESSAAAAATTTQTVACGPGPGQDPAHAAVAAIADVRDLRGEVRDLETRLAKVEKMASSINDDGFAATFPRVEARVGKLEAAQQGRDKDSVALYAKELAVLKQRSKRDEDLWARVESLEKSLAKTAAGPASGAQSGFSTLGFAPVKPGAKHGLDSDPEGHSRKKPKKDDTAVESCAGSRDDKEGRANIRSLLNPPALYPAEGITSPEKFLQFLHTMDCGNEAQLEQLHRITSGPVSLEFPLFGNHKGDRSDNWILKVGGKLRNQIRPHRRAVFNVRVKAQKAEEEERAKKLGWLECLVTGQAKVEGETQIPRYFVQLGEIYGLARFRAGTNPDRIASTNFFVLLACEERSLWVMFKFAENRDDGDNDDDDDDVPASFVPSSKSRDVAFKSPLTLGKSFDAACILQDVKAWKDPHRPILSEDGFSQFFKQGYQGAKPELILPLMADLEKHLNK